MTQDFNGFGLPPKLMQSLTRLRYTIPTAIQEQAIPPALEGKDILGTAETGTGKTAAFGIPLITHLMNRPEASAIILTPTRELASQVLASLQQLIPLPTIKTALLIGGEPMPRQFRQLQQKPQVIVGTPGRVNDHLMRGTLKLNHARFLVLDETDRMLDMGFGPQIDAVVQHLPSERQTMMFSATLPSNIMKMASKYLRDPVRITIGTVNKPTLQVKQEMVRTNEGEKYNMLLQQLETRTGSIIVFVKTKHGADRLANKLNRNDHKSEAIHGNLPQKKRDRVITDFRNERCRILVATDVVARGLDIPHIEHVINYDLPQCPEDYIHRIGRTGRAGAEGHAVSLVSSGDNALWNAIQRLINPEEAARHKNSGQRSEHRSDAPRGNHPKKPFRNKKRFGNRDGGRDSANDGGRDGNREGRSGGRDGARANTNRPRSHNRDTRAA